VTRREPIWRSFDAALDARWRNAQRSSSSFTAFCPMRCAAMTVRRSATSLSLPCSLWTPGRRVRATSGQHEGCRRFSRAGREGSTNAWRCCSTRRATMSPFASARSWLWRPRQTSASTGARCSAMSCGGTTRSSGAEKMGTKLLRGGPATASEETAAAKTRESED